MTSMSRFLSQHWYHLDCNLPVTESNLSLLQVTLFAAGGVGKCASAYDVLLRSIAQIVSYNHLYAHIDNKPLLFHYSLLVFLPLLL